MYIRRKVFSLLQDELTGEERYYSTTEFELEDGLDERYYSDDEKGMSTGAKIGIGAGATTAAAAAALIAAKKGAFGGKIQKEVGEQIMKIGDKIGSRKLYMSGADDYVRGSVKVSDKLKGRIKDMDETGRKIYDKKVKSQVDELENAYNIRKWQRGEKLTDKEKEVLKKYKNSRALPAK